MIKINLLKAGNEKRGGQTKKGFSGGFFNRTNEFFEEAPKESSSSLGLTEDDHDINFIVILFKLSLAFAGVIALYVHEMQNIPILTQNLSVEQAKLAELKSFNGKAAGVVAEIKKMKQNKIVIEKQIDSIEGLNKHRLRYIKALDIIQQSMPEKMWLTTVRSEKDLIVLEGISFSEIEISTFIEAISKFIQFSDILLSSSQDSELTYAGGKRLKRFVINCTLEKLP